MANLSKLTPSERAALDEVIEARKRRERAQQYERETVEYALSLGLSYADVAIELGVTRQAVRQYVERGRKS